MLKDAFFKAAGPFALTFDDVRLVPGHSSTAPKDIDVRTMFSRNVPLNCPVASAAMDTVTESPMAIAMAEFGGIGVIHRKLEPEGQAKQVAKVKWWLNGFIQTPKTAFGHQTVREVLERREKKDYRFHSFPVVDQEGRLIGLMNERRFNRCENPEALIRDVMAKQVTVAPPGTDIDRAYEIMIAEDADIVILADDGKKIAGMYTFSDIRRIKKGTSPQCNLDANGHLRVAAAIGTGEEALARARLLVEARADVIVIDTAHGDTDAVLWTLRQMKKMFPGTDVVAGNIADGGAAKRLVEAGADGVKVGIGPGSICTTRIVTGVGVPQVTAIYECALAIEGSGVPVCGDGGIKYSGDITVAIGAGAHCVMIGKLLAGTDESPGKVVFTRGAQYKIYRGMGSLPSMMESREACNRYGQNPEVGKDKLVPEGVPGLVPYDGPVARLLFQFVGGLRSGMGLAGAANIAEMREKASFCQISSAGLAESHPHDIIITEDAPNYKRQQSPMGGKEQS